MNLKHLKRTTALLFLLVLISNNLIAQTTKVEVLQDPKFTNLLNEKRKINNLINASEGYKIQIYNGDNESARRELNKFKSEFDYLDATIIFNTPYYKVWVGNFKTKIDAQRNLADVQKKYTNAIIFKPTR